MSTRRSPFLLIDIALAALALLWLCAPTAQPAPGPEGAVYVEYDPAAPFDGQRSYVCLADLEKDATTGQRRTLDCQIEPLVDICGKNDDGTALSSRCDNLLPGAGTPPTAQQAAALRTALEAHFEGNLTKLNYVIAQIGLGGKAAYEMNWQPGPSGSSPDIGGWNDATATEREVLQTPLEVIDPDNPDSRFGNTAWRHPDGDEWTALLPPAQLDKVEAASRNLLLQENPVPPTTAEVTARAAEEVVNCRGDSISAIRTDMETGLRTAGGASGLARPPAIMDCLANPGPPVPVNPNPNPPPPPPPTFTACDGSVHSTQAAANAVTCPGTNPNPNPPPTYTACDGSVHSSWSAAQSVDCSSDDDYEEEEEEEETPTTPTPTTTPTTPTTPTTTPTTPTTTPPTTSKPDPEPEPDPPPSTPSITCWDGSSVEDASDCPTPDYGGGGGGGGDDDDDTTTTVVDDDDDTTTTTTVVDDDDDEVVDDPICTVSDCEGEDDTTTTVVDDDDDDTDTTPDDLLDCEGGPECPYNPNNDDTCDWLSWC